MVTRKPAKKHNTDPVSQLRNRLAQLRKNKQWTLEQLPQRLPIFLDWVERRRAGDPRPEPELPVVQFIRSGDAPESTRTGAPLRTADLAE